MPKTILAAMAALALVACAQPAEDHEAPLPLVEGDDGPDSGPPGTCADQGDFDLEVFVAEIFPILNGDIDLNDPDSENVLTGCTRGPCHAQERGGLTLSASLTPEENLEAFACYVDLRRPKRSQVLVCPSGDGQGCSVGPHPGAEIFDPPGDLNYSRILAYIRASRP